MENRYKKIKTAAELIADVRIHGMSTDQGDIVAIQDILGNSTDEELVVLANGAETREYFYFVLFNIWHWGDAVRFWNRYSNEDRRNLEEISMKYEELRDKFVKSEEALACAKNDSLASTTDANRAEKENAQLRKDLAEANQTILMLKAKLYDALIAKED